MTHDAPGRMRTFVMRALGRTVYRRLAWMERRIDEPFPLPQADVLLQMRFALPADTEEVAALRTDLPRGEIERRFSAGDRCFGAWHEGRLVSCSWMSTGVARIPYLGLARRLPSGVVYHHDLLTDASLRGHRIAAALGATIRRQLAAEGVVHVAAAILPENGAGLANLRRGGYVHVATIGWIGVGPFKRRFVRYVPRQRR